MAAYAGLNQQYWEYKGATGHQFGHVDQEWQDLRSQPDRSGAMRGLGNVHGLGGVSINDCPLGRLRLGDSPRKPPPDRPEFPIGAPRDIARYKHEFDKKDYEGDGQIETKELAQVMKALGRILSASAAKMLVQAIDMDGSGSVDFDEFIQGCFGVRQRRLDDPAPLSKKQVVYLAMQEAVQKEDLRGMRTLIEANGIRGFSDEAGDLDILHVAASKGFPPMLSLLLENKADPNQHAGGVLKKTPLHFAAESSHPQRERAVCTLLASGAIAKSRDSNGYTPLDRFAVASNSSGFSWVDHPDTLERFNEHRRDHPEAHGYHVLPPISNVPKAHKHRKHREDGSTKRKSKHRHHHGE